MMREVPPLHHVRHKQIIELLIENGADVNAIIATGETQGKTPLDLASKAEISDLLRKHGGKTGDELKAEDRRSTH